MTRFDVRQEDVALVAADILLLKHAQAFFGADRAVAERLVAAERCTIASLAPKPGEHVIVETGGTLSPDRVLFLGTPRLGAFTYGEMQRFARQAIEVISGLPGPVRTMTTTIHGTGFGLDGGEALQCLVRGFREGLALYRTALESITFLTLSGRQKRMLRRAIEHLDRETSEVDDRQRPIPSGPEPVPDPRPETPALAPPAATAASPDEKKRVFVAMPFSEEFQNVYEYGIYPAVRNCDLICEKVDETHFTGDILRRIRKGIESASLVIADLTDGRPNVYLEVGYAWGKSVPVVFVAKKDEKLHFDVSTHRCVFYGHFRTFAATLEELIHGLQSRGHL